MNAKWAILLASTSLVLTGCLGNSSNDSVATVVDPDPVLVPGPLGLTFDTAVNVMSADADKNTVRVANDVASITLNDLTFDEDELSDDFGDIESFSITLTLPDGTSVTVTDEDIQKIKDDDIHGGPAIEVYLESADGTPVSLTFGLGLGSAASGGNDDYDTEKEEADEALFVLARLDPVADDPDFGVDTYMVTGARTATLPEGVAHYEGRVRASIYENGELVDGYVKGYVNVDADFANSEVDIDLQSWGSGYSLQGDDLPITGSDYAGGIVGTVNASGSTNVAGDLLGAFFGADAEATAGVFGANETAKEALNNNADVEIVGYFGAYDQDQIPQ